MKITHALAPLLAAGAITAAQAQTPEAQADAAANQTIHDIRAGFVPLVADPIDLAQASDPLWTAGSQPPKSAIARLTLKPVGTVVADPAPGSDGKKLVLLRAFAGDPERFVRAADLPAAGSRLYCADGDEGPRADTRLRCFEDRDGDGTFDASGPGVAEWGSKAEQLALLGRFEPLKAPLRYRPARADEQPVYKSVISQCTRGHDQPSYRFSLDRPANDVLNLATLVANGGDISMLGAMGPGCVESAKVRDGDALAPAALPKGASAIRMGELVLVAAPKEAGSAVKLLGLRQADRLYRITFNSVAAVSENPTEKQKRLAVAQKFDKPVFAASGRFDVAEGPHGVGDTVATVGFRHGYMGVLTQETKIRTLLSSRSLPAGTVLYGIPMSSSKIRTYGGVPIGATRPAGTPEPEAVHLTWCVPVEEELKWTATCMPSEGGERYTILKGQRPAFEVRSLTYPSGRTTNQGMAPVAIKDVAFERPLAWRFRIKELTDSLVVLAQETLYGEEVVETREQRILRVKGEYAGLIVGDAVIAFADGADGKVTVRRVRPLAAGGDVAVQTGILDRQAVDKALGSH